MHVCMFVYFILSLALSHSRLGDDFLLKYSFISYSSSCSISCFFSLSLLSSLRIQMREPSSLDVFISLSYWTGRIASFWFLSYSSYLTLPMMVFFSIVPCISGHLSFFRLFVCSQLNDMLYYYIS